MSQAFIFRKDCWIYTKKSERDNMKSAIQGLKKYGSLCISGFRHYMPNKSEHSVRLAVYYLLAGGIINVKQRGEIRIFRFAPNWEKKLKKALSWPPKNQENKSVGRVKENKEGSTD